MARRIFRQLIPVKRAINGGNPLLSLFGSLLLHPRLWHVNRHSAAIGAASGVFWAWICAPVQTVGAFLMSVWGKGNVPIAMAFTWVSNPLTWVPCFWLAYEVGLPLTPAERVDGFGTLVSEAMDAGLIDGFVVTGQFLFENLPQLYPIYVGGVILGIISASATYVAVNTMWRWHVGRRWRRRHAERSLADRPLSRGLAALGRLRDFKPMPARRVA
ncbi:MAG: DUF2062 domain-containing protein [Planctomycetota bacterium]